MNKNNTLNNTFAFAMAAATLSMSCSGGGATPPTGEDPNNPMVLARRSALESIGERVVATNYATFATRAAALEESAAAWAAAPTDDTLRESARADWRAAMETWQRAEVLLIGPAGVMSEVAGGEDLRDEIYSWPLDNPCSVDQKLADESYAQDAFFTANLANTRGLDAMEYLLFEVGEENACAPNASLNTSGAWAALDAQTLQSRRATYAARLGGELARQSVVLRDAWSGGEDGFGQALASAGDDGAPYPTTQEALNAVSTAMFYLDKETVDMKLAVAAGLKDCLEEICPEEVESLYAANSVVHLRENLAGFRAAFTGGEPGDADAFGFDDLLTELGAGEVAAQMLSDIDEAQAALGKLDDSLAVAVREQPEDAAAAHASMKVVVDLFKTQILGLLDLELPARAEGDND